MSEIRMRYVGRTQMPFGEEVLKWELVTDAPEEEVWKFCKMEICSNRPVKTKAEWEDLLRETDRADDKDANFETYAKGWVKLTRLGKNRWWFEKHFPNLD